MATPFFSTIIRIIANQARKIAAGTAIVLLFQPTLHATPQKITLQLKWKHQFQFAGYYAAKAKGYYSEAGLDVEIREFNGNNPPIEEVLAHRATFGIANSDLLIRYMNGDPLVVLAPIFQSSPSVLLVREESNIVTPKDLIGKTIELNIKNGGSSEIMAMLLHEGVKPSMFRGTEASYSLNKFLNGAVDAMEAYQSNEPYFLDKYGIPYRKIIPSDYGIDFYAECLFTTSDVIRHDQAMVDEFLHASLRGWDYSLKHPEELVRIIQNEYKSTRTTEQLLFEAGQVKKFIQNNIVDIGHSNKGRWLEITQQLLNVGLITQPKQLEPFLYNSSNYSRNNRKLYLSLILGGIAGIILLYLFHLRQFKRSRKGFNLAVSALKQEISHLNNQKYELEHRIDKLIEENNALNAFKESLLSNISFDIRTPLSTIVGFGELLQNHRLKPSQTIYYTREINRSGKLLQEQIDNIIEISKLDTKQKNLVYNRINPANFFYYIRQLLLRELKLHDKEHLEIRLSIDSELRFDILTDRILLKGIFIRLISNAVKNTTRGYIELGCRKINNSYLHLWIQDSGSGIPQELQEIIFEPYNRYQSENFGLGLLIAKGYVEMLNGKIWIESDEGTGTSVNIELPFTPIGKRSALPEPIDYSIPPPMHGKTILIVEDNYPNYILLCKLLEGCGATIKHAKTGAEALELFNSTPTIDLIFMDLRLPDIDGIEIIREIRQVNKTAVIIAQTAYSSGVKINLSIEAGCNDFLTKPITPTDLNSTLRKFFPTESESANSSATA